MVFSNILSLGIPTLVRRLGILVTVSLALAQPAGATKPGNITASEMALIPKYCPDTQGFGYGDAYYNTSPRAKRWVAVMGKSFWHMHHYCWAQINLKRATSPGVNPEIRKGTLENVRGDYLYVLDHVAPDFVLLPEILTRLGDVQLLLKRPGDADQAFARARQIKPDYWPAYSHWAEHLIATGNRAEAKELVKSGLEYVPTAKGLQEQYRLLGGKLSEIVPRPPVKEADSETSENPENADSPQAKMPLPASNTAETKQ